MKFDPSQFSWVDMLTVVVLILGIFRGRKRGLSEELLDTVQWVVIVLAAGLFYRTTAQAIGQGELMGPIYYRIAAYLLIALLVKLPFSLLKRQVGEKLVGSDFFGKTEYYLGMQAGMIRFACVFLFLLSLLHAPYYSPEDLAADARNQEKNFGEVRFPTIGTLQQTVFKTSLTGQALEQYLNPLLIVSTKSPVPELGSNSSLAKRHQHSIDAVMEEK